jgi:hypothetical protein
MLETWLPGIRARLGALGVGRVRMLRAVQGSLVSPLERKVKDWNARPEKGRRRERPGALLARRTRSGSSVWLAGLSGLSGSSE